MSYCLPHICAKKDAHPARCNSPGICISVEGSGYDSIEHASKPKSHANPFRPFSRSCIRLCARVYLEIHHVRCGSQPCRLLLLPLAQMGMAICLLERETRMDVKQEERVWQNHQGPNETGIISQVRLMFLRGKQQMMHRLRRSLSLHLKA